MHLVALQFAWKRTAWSSMDLYRIESSLLLSQIKSSTFRKLWNNYWNYLLQWLHRQNGFLRINEKVVMLFRSTEPCGHNLRLKLAARKACQIFKSKNFRHCFSEVNPADYYRYFYLLFDLDSYLFLFWLIDFFDFKKHFWKIELKFPCN